MNRKIVLSLLSIFSATAIAGIATYAFFTSTATSQNNTFTAGTLNLTIDDPNHDFAQNQTASFTVNDMLPGATPVAGFFSLHNSGSLNMSSVNVTLNTTSNGSPDLSGVIDVPAVTFGDDSTCTNGTTNIVPTITAQTGLTPPFTFGVLNNNTFSLPGITSGATKYMCFTYNLDAGANNTYQGASTTQAFTFVGNQ